MNSVVILGAGNVAFHLTRALLQNTVDLRQVFNRTLFKAQELGEANSIKYTDRISEIAKADLYIIAVSDSGIEELSHYIPYSDALVVHTSGTMNTNVLKGNYRKGVLYPFQTFTKGRPMNYDNIPFFIETEDPNDSEGLIRLAKKISNKVETADSAKRLQIHMSGVMANNFTNHLFYLAEQICKESGFSFDVLRPLIGETALKIKDLSPKDAQTGPARRGDKAVIEKHLETIEDSRLQQLYKLISDSIERTYSP